MGNFSPLVKKSYTFQGDNVHVEFARLKRKDMLLLMPLLKKVSTSQAVDDSEHAEAVSEMINVALDFMPTYIHSLKGLLQSDGEQIDVNTLCSEMYFIDLASDILTDIIEESIVIHGGADSKKP
jgi:hypothetical protein